MGVWEWIYSATDHVIQRTPDITPVTGFYWKGYDVGRNATTQVNGAVRTKASELYEYFSDDQNRSNVARIATSVSKNGALHLARYYGGGPVLDVVSRSLLDSKADPQKERIKELETRLAKLEKEFNTQKKAEQESVPRANIPAGPKDEPDNNANLNQSPEDVLRCFMMKPFISTRLLDDLIVPGTRSRRKEEPISSVDGQYE